MNDQRPFFRPSRAGALRGNGSRAPYAPDVGQPGEGARFCGVDILLEVRELPTADGPDMDDVCIGRASRGFARATIAALYNDHVPRVMEAFRLTVKPSHSVPRRRKLCPRLVAAQ